MHIVLLILLHHILKKRVIALELLEFIILIHALIVIIGKQGFSNGYYLLLYLTSFLQLEEVNDCDEERDQEKYSRDGEIIDEVGFLIDEGLIL